MSGFGAIDIGAAAAVASVSAIAALTDLRSGRIPNWLTLPALALGLIYSTVIGGWAGLGLSLLAALCALLLLGWMFAIRVMGGGDVKLLMALSAWSTPRFALEAAILSVLVGGLMAAGILLARGRMRSFIEKMRKFLFTLMVRELEVIKPKLDPTLTMPFGIAIAVASVWTILDWPLKKWGLLPW